MLQLNSITYLHHQIGIDSSRLEPCTRRTASNSLWANTEEITVVYS